MKKTIRRLLFPIALALCGFDAESATRLVIDVVPVEIEMELYEEWTDDTPRGIVRPNSTALTVALARVHEAMALLGVAGDRYLLRVVGPARRERCSPLLATTPAFACPQFSGEGVMTTRYGYSPKTGRVVLALLLFPDHSSFQWGGNGLLFGTASVRYAPGQSAGRHWSESSCLAWSVPWTRTLAHELGHCFGLYHTNSWPEEWTDINDPDALDSRMDLMTPTSQGGNLSMTWLKPSNRRQICRFFRRGNEDCD